MSFAVQAHPSRSVRASALAVEIGGDVVWDPDPGARRSPWRTFRHLLATTPQEATHRFQIQDDARACPGLRQAVLRAVEARPAHLLVFYVGTQQSRFTKAVLDACRRDESWALLPPGHWAPVVATCWPRPLIDAMLDYTRLWPDSHVSDDELVGGWLKHAGLRALASVPSLVEHDDDVIPVGGTRLVTRAEMHQARRAACFIGDCADCVEGIDWTVGPG